MITLHRTLARLSLPWLLSLAADKTDWPPWTAEQFMMDLPQKWELSVMSDHGVAIISTRPGHPHLHLLAIAPEVRGQGHGSALLHEAIRRGVVSLKVPGDDEGVMRFYRRHGFAFHPRWLSMERAIS